MLEVVQRFAVSYIYKPVIIENLVERISAIFRGRDFIDQHCGQMKIPTGYRNLRIDVTNHTVYRGDELIALTRREYDLLATLMGSKKVLTREQLLESVWKYESATETNIVDVYIRYLRSKIDVEGQKKLYQNSSWCRLYHAGLMSNILLIKVEEHLPISKCFFEVLIASFLKVEKMISLIFYLNDKRL